MNLQIQEQVPLAPYTTLKVGGPARYLVTVNTVDELKAALAFAEASTSESPMVIGSGSNVLFRDEGYEGLVILVALKGVDLVVKDDDVILTCGAGEDLDEVIAYTVLEGWWGLENLSTIPGTVGATPVQNVGAYGVEVSDLVVSVSAVHRSTRQERVFTPEECEFGYRDSFFKSDTGRDWVITAVSFRLSREPRPMLSYADLKPLSEQKDVSLEGIRSTVASIRSKKFPDWQIMGTAGSFFKNPVISLEMFEKLKDQYPELPSYPHEKGVKIPLGYVLDKICGLKGIKRGSVGLYEEQALVLVADPEAYAQDILSFVDFISDTVKEKTDIVIEPEVRIV